MTPWRNASPPTSSTSRMPAISTPQAAAWPGVGNNTATASVAIIDRLSRIGRRGGGRETGDRVEDAAVERHQGDQQEIGKRDPRELDRQREAAGILGKPRRQQRDHRRREEEREGDQDDLGWQTAA